MNDLSRLTPGTTIGELYHSEDELYHRKKQKKRKEKEDHKYVAKIEEGDKTRYFYTKEEWLAYLDKKKSAKLPIDKPKNSSDATALKTSYRDMLDKGRDLAKNTMHGIEKVLEEKPATPAVYTKVQEFVGNTLDKIGETSIGNESKLGGKLDDVVDIATTWAKGGLLKVVLDELVDSVVENQAEKQAEEERKKKEEERRKQEEWYRWQAEEQERYKESQERFKQTQAEIKANKEASELNEQEENIQELAMSDDYIPELDIKDEACTKEEDMEAVNPYYEGGNSYAYSQNCAYCTAAYDLRQRGYDVEAAAIEWPNPNTIDVIADWYEGEEITTCNDILEQSNSQFLTYDDAARLIENDLKKEGDGARGHFCLYWSDGGGHDVVWEVDNNKVILRDCQTNNTHDVYELLQYANYFEYFRTDNIDVNPSITKTVINRDESKKRSDW